MSSLTVGYQKISLEIKRGRSVRLPTAICHF
jgi:hypothetical protein